MSLEKRLLRQDSRAGALLLLAVGAGFLAAAMLATQAWLLSVVVERVFLQKQVLIEMTPWLASMLVIISIRSAALWSEAILAQRSASRIKSNLRQQISASLFRAGPAFTQLKRSGELTSVAVEGVEALDAYLTQYLPARYLAFSVTAFIFFFVLALDPWTSLVLIATGPFLVVLLVLIGGRSKAITERRFLELSWMSAFFLDILQGIGTLKMFGRSREQADNIEAISKRFGATTMEILRTAFQTSLVMEWAATAATAMVAVEVSLRLMQHSLSLERGLAVLLLTPEFFLPLRQLALRYHSGTAGKSAAERIFTILDAPISSGHETSRSNRVELEIPQKGDIHFENVSFAYQGGQRSALRNCRLDIPYGKITALVGPSGAGKTTVSSLILRFIEPQSGKIQLDDIDLTDLDPERWRGRIAWVPQHPRLFHGTIEENIRLANPHASREEVIQSAQDANAHDFIQSLPQDYLTQVGDLGAKLSGGQAQRIAIARAYLKDVPYLIVDEATAHLDAESEALILDALTRLSRSRTALVIAHRLPMAARADRIVVLDQGQVVETGDHHSLMVEGGLYARMAAAVLGGAG